MHVIELRAENYKRLVAIDVAPRGHVVEVVGKNAQGKTSLLESMLVALGGAGAIPSKPIRKGETKASIRLKLGDDKPTLIVTRTFASKDDGGYTTHLTVEAADGARYAKPQQILDDLLGALAFDPLAFTRMKSLEQLHELRAFVPGVDFDEIDAANKGDYERRTAVNRQAKQMGAQLAAITVPGDPRHTRIDEATLVAQLEAAGEQNAEIERRKAAREKASDNAAKLRVDAGRDREAATDLREQAAEMIAKADSIDAVAVKREADAATLEQKLADAPALPAATDTAEIKTAITAARTTNAAMDARERAMSERVRLTDEIKALEAQSQGFTDGIAAREAQKAAAVAAVTLPVDGLGFGDGEVLLNGLPFDQASSAEKLRVSIAIAAARNSKLRVIHVRDGSLLDEDGMALLREFAEANDMQVWCERVASDSAVGIVIEDGSVKVVAEASAA